MKPVFPKESFSLSLAKGTQGSPRNLGQCCCLRIKVHASLQDHPSLLTSPQSSLQSPSPVTLKTHSVFSRDSLVSFNKLSLSHPQSDFFSFFTVPLIFIWLRNLQGGPPRIPFQRVQSLLTERACWFDSPEVCMGDLFLLAFAPYSASSAASYLTCYASLRFRASLCLSHP